MKKVKLRIDDLRVDTFETTSVLDEKGTVFGEAWSQPLQASCNGMETCADTCDPACHSNQTCEYFTCVGFVSRYGDDQLCVIC